MILTNGAIVIFTFIALLAVYWGIQNDKTRQL